MKQNTLFLIILIIFILGAGVCLSQNNIQYSSSSSNFYLENYKDFFKPLIKSADKPSLNANIALVALDDGDEKILYAKNLKEKSAIASLTKLMTAVVVIENYPLDSLIEIDEQTLEDTWGTSGNLRSGEHITVEDLLKIMLIESSNDAAECLASKINRDNFLFLMNEKAKELKMKSTSFVNPSGLDEDNGDCNISSAQDLATLISYIIKEYPLISEILSSKEDYVISQEGIYHALENTNILLEELPQESWGKTGYTEKANGCLVLMTKTPNDDTIINIIINADERFEEMEKLINWTDNTFVF